MYVLKLVLINSRAYNILNFPCRCWHSLNKSSHKYMKSIYGKSVYYWLNMHALRPNGNVISGKLQ